MRHEIFEVLIIEGLLTVSKNGVFGDDLLRLRQLRVDSGQLVDRRSNSEAGDVRRQQLLVQGVAQNISLALLPLPVGVGAVAIALLSSAAAVLEVIAVGGGGGGAGLTLGREPVVVEGGGVEPGRARWFVVGMIGEDGAEDGGGGGRVVVGVVGMVEGHFLGEVVVVVLKGHVCVNDEAVSFSQLPIHCY